MSWPNVGKKGGPNSSSLAKESLTYAHTIEEMNLDIQDDRAECNRQNGADSILSSKES